MAAQIINLPYNPRKYKSLGRKVQGFDEAIWATHAREIVQKGCLLKFSQNDDLKEYLLSTGNRLLAEASPYDKIWGIGLAKLDAARVPQERWTGKNWLGECLMAVRKTLQEQEEERRNKS